MRQLSYWQRNPYLREYALKIDAGGASRKQVLVALADKFGDLAPTDESMITRLRMGAAKGEWNSRPRQPRNKAPIRRKEPRGERLYPRHWLYWKAHPGLCEFAIGIITQENQVIQQAIKDRFGPNYTPTEAQITMLRNRITTKDQWVDAITAPEAQSNKGNELGSAKTISGAALRLFSNEQATECQIPGIRLLTRLGCLKQQLQKRLVGSESYMNGAAGARDTRRVTNPNLMWCAKCLNYLSHTDLRLIQRGLKKGRIALEATK